MTAPGDAVRQIAQAVLYEGYVLWPYRRSALKNRRRWTFGGVFPPVWNEAHPDDPRELRAGCLIETREAGALRVEVRARFLHIVRRQALDPGGEPVDELVSGGERHLSWDEATERELPPGRFRFPAGSVRDPLEGGGALIRSWEELEGELEVALQPTSAGTTRLSVRLANTTGWSGSARGEALRRSFCSTHLVLRVTGGAFVSPLDPRAAECRNEGLWPVLVGEPPDRSTVLASPIILEDYPHVAPESPGDLFDGGEIDQLLTLSILALTAEEKEEMRASDPRTREILERTEAMTAEDLMRLHGTFRELRSPDGGV